MTIKQDLPRLCQVRVWPVKGIPTLCNRPAPDGLKDENGRAICKGHHAQEEAVPLWKRALDRFSKGELTLAFDPREESVGRASNGSGPNL
jgi:hypothetical protein